MSLVDVSTALIEIMSDRGAVTMTTKASPAARARYYHAIHHACHHLSGFPVRNLSLELTLMLSAFMLTTVTADQQAACAAVTCAAVASLLSRLRRAHAQRASDFNQDRVRVVTARACEHVCKGTVYELRSSSRIGPRPGLNKVTMVSLSPERRPIFQSV